MVGGKVIEVCDHPLDQNKIYVNVADRPHRRLEECAIYVVRDSNSEQIEIGDSLWWQGRYAYWTPQSGTREKCGVDYDIPIERIGFSGVSHPYRKTEDTQ